MDGLQSIRATRSRGGPTRVPPADTAVSLATTVSGVDLFDHPHHPGSRTHRISRSSGILTWNPSWDGASALSYDLDRYLFAQHPTIWLDVAGPDERGAFHAIADPTRRLILEELAKRDDQTLYELCVRMLTGHGVDMSRQGIEKHLAILEEAGLVDSERHGKYKVLRLDTGPLHRDVEPWVRRLTKQRMDRS